MIERDRIARADLPRVGPSGAESDLPEEVELFLARRRPRSLSLFAAQAFRRESLLMRLSLPHADATIERYSGKIDLQEFVPEHGSQQVGVMRDS